MTLRIRALTLGANICEVLWKHHRTIPPLLNIVNKSSMIIRFLSNKKMFDLMLQSNLLVIVHFDFCTRQTDTGRNLRTKTIRYDET